MPQFRLRFHTFTDDLASNFVTKWTQRVKTVNAKCTACDDDDVADRAVSRHNNSK